MSGTGDPPTTDGLVLFVGSDVVGRGEDHQLGSLLMQKLLHTVGGHRLKPATVLLMNSGVKLVAENSLASGELREMEDQGVSILSCGTCLSRFQLHDRVTVGQVSNMSDMVDAMLRAERVISV